MLQQSTEHLHCQMIQPTKKRLWRQSLIPLLTTFQLQSITQMSHFNSKCLFLTTMISLVVSVSDVSSVVLLRSETKLPFLNWMVQPRTSVWRNSLVSLVWNAVKSKKPRLVTWLPYQVWKISLSGKQSLQQMQLKLFQFFTSTNLLFKWPSWLTTHHLLVAKVNGLLLVRLKNVFKLSCKQTYLFV